MNQILNSNDVTIFNAYGVDEILSATDAKNDYSFGYFGFPKFDRAIGGLRKEVYVLAGYSSMGKTTFSVQLAIQIAKQDIPVIYFTLDQSRRDICSKAITCSYSLDNIQSIKTLYNNGYPISDVKNYVLSGNHNNWCRNLSVCDEIISGSSYFYDICKYIDRVKESTNGKTPIIFIDYLQLLKSESSNTIINEKQNIDIAMTNIKLLRKKYDTTVFILSSVGRLYHYKPIMMESLKESGNIEFESDVIIGIQPSVMFTDKFVYVNKFTNKETNDTYRSNLINAEKEKSMIPMTINCIKNRNRKDETFKIDFLFCKNGQIFVEASNFNKHDLTDSPNEDVIDNKLHVKF